jgi:hypothetical protein
MEFAILLWSLVGYNYDKKYYCCMSIACDFEVNWWFKYLRLP